MPINITIIVVTVTKSQTEYKFSSHREGPM